MYINNLRETVHAIYENWFKNLVIYKVLQVQKNLWTLELRTSQRIRLQPSITQCEPVQIKTVANSCNQNLAESLDVLHVLKTPEEREREGKKKTKKQNCTTKYSCKQQSGGQTATGHSCHGNVVSFYQQHGCVQLSCQLTKDISSLPVW